MEESPTLAGHLRTDLRTSVRTAQSFSGGQAATVMDPETAETLRSLGYVQ